MTKPYICLVASLAFMLSACGGVMDDEDHEDRVPSSVRITTSLKAPSPGSRATSDEVMNAQTTLLNTQNKLGVFVFKTGFTTSTSISDHVGSYGYKNQQFIVGNLVGGTKNELNWVKPSGETGDKIMYPADVTNIDVYMYAPYNSSVSSLATQQKFSVAATQTADNYINNDVLWGVVKNNTFNTDVDCTLKHVYAKVVVKIVLGKDRQGSVTDFNNISSVQLKGAYLSSTVNLQDGSVPTDPQSGVNIGDVKDNITLWRADSPITDNGKPVLNSVCVLPPQVTTAGIGDDKKMELLITYKEDDETVTYSFKPADNKTFQFKSGEVTTFVFSINPDGIQNLSTDITNWSDGTTTLPSTEHAF